MYITELNTNEGKKHLEAKNKLFISVVDRTVKFVDQFNNIITTSGFEFASMEAYVYRNSYGNDHFFSGQCSACGGCFDIEDNCDEEVKINDYRFSNVNEYNKNIYILDQENDIQAYYSHPCNLCEFKGNLHCQFIFDIGLAHEGKYCVAIEIYNSNSPTEHKIRYCMDNEIQLLEVRAVDVFNHLESGIIPCRRLWW